ncbi:MAG: hypothetical protein V1742_11060 [Pseudomonadota bacterium]
MSDRIFIPSGKIELEGLFDRRDPKRAGVVAHPHPLYGGSMHNHVVQAAAEGLIQAGWTSLRFNFRGVGRSTGAHGQGLGEQEDLAAAASFLKEWAEEVLVVGYSFGAWVAAFAWPRLHELGVLPLALIAPPAVFMNFDELPPETQVGLIVCGQFDDIGPPDLAAGLGKHLKTQIEPIIIPESDHFFGGRETEISRIIAEYLK